MPRRGPVSFILLLYFVLSAGYAQCAPIIEQIQELVALGDRNVGSEGNQEAARHIKQAFEAVARSVAPSPSGTTAVTGAQSFLVPVISNTASSIQLQDRSEQIRPLLLNALSTGAIPEPGLEGRVLYAGQGRLRDFNDMDVQDAIVLMDMESGKNWQNAALLGAKALIFIAQDGAQSASRGLYEQKTELTPIDFPRFWMRKSRAEAFFGDLNALSGEGSTSTVRLASSIAWRNVVTENIYCLIPGTDPELAKELLVLDAFYDSTAYVSGASPGADEASSIATLLQLADDFSRNPPKRSVLLLATSGHARDVAGMREVVWALTSERDSLAALLDKQVNRLEQATRTMTLLAPDDPLRTAHTLMQDDVEHMRSALRSVIKSRLEAVNTELIKLRLQQDPDTERIRHLADQRNRLRRVTWVESARAAEKITPDEKELLDALLADARAEQQSIAEDAAPAAGFPAKQPGPARPGRLLHHCGHGQPAPFLARRRTRRL